MMVGVRCGSVSEVRVSSKVAVAGSSGSVWVALSTLMTLNLCPTVSSPLAGKSCIASGNFGSKVSDISSSESISCCIFTSACCLFTISPSCSTFIIKWLYLSQTLLSACWRVV